MINYYLYLFEFGAIFTFVAILFRERENKSLFESIILAFFYGLLLEIINVHLSQSYFYSKDFLLQAYDAPLAIGTGWAIIYYCARKTAESYNLKWWQSPLLMALVALSVDLAIDAVAIRLGFWSWKIPLNQEWFGVPYDNLFGWLAVIWTFSFFINLSEQKFLSKGAGKFIKYFSVIISPFLLSLQITLYVSLSAIISGRFSPDGVFNFYRQGDFSYAYYPEVQNFKAGIFAAIVFILMLYIGKEVYKSKKRVTIKETSFPFFILLAIDLFFLIAIFTAGIYVKLPALLVISAFVLFVHPLFSFAKNNPVITAIIKANAIFNIIFIPPVY